MSKLFKTVVYTCILMKFKIAHKRDDNPPVSSTAISVLTRILSTFAGSGAESLVHCRVSVWKWLIFPFEIAMLCYFNREMVISQWIFRFSPRFSGLNPYLNGLVFQGTSLKPMEDQSQVFAFMSFAMEAGSCRLPASSLGEVAQVSALIPRSGSLQGKAAAPDTSRILGPPQKKLLFWYFSLESELRSLGCLLLFNVQSTLYFYNFLHGAALQSCVIIVQHGLSMVKVYSSHAHVFIL